MPVTLAELSQISGGELLYRIFVSSNLMCKRCSKFLFSPITLVAGLGNFCGFCADPQITATGIRNSALETILEILPVPCRNSYRGCTSVVEYSKTEEHLAICIFRDYHCLLKHFGKCNWEGSLSELINHSLEKHPYFAIRGRGDCEKRFTLAVNLTFNNDILKLLYTENDTFILRIKCNSEASTVQFIVYYTGLAKELSNFSYIIYYGMCDNVYSTPIRAILHDTEFTKDFDERQALNIDVTFTKQFVNNILLTTVIKIVSQPIDRNEQLSDGSLEVVNCFICKSPLQSTTAQSLSEQDASNPSDLKSLCPTCKIDFDTTSSWTKCKYRNKRRSRILRRKIPTGQLKLHTCFVGRCRWRGVYSSIIAHLRIKHKRIVLFKNCINTTLRRHTDYVRCVVAHGQIFVVSFTDLEDIQCMHCTVQLIGPKNVAKKYQYTVTVLDSRNEHRTYVRNDICQSITCTDEDLLACVYIPYAILEQYSVNGRFPAQCKIMKLTDFIS